MCRQSRRGCCGHWGLREHHRHQLCLELKASGSGGGSPRWQLLPGPCLFRKSKPQPCCHGCQPLPAALPSKSQGDLLAARKGFFLGQQGLVAGLLPVSSLPAGLATPLTAPTLPAPTSQLGDALGHPTSHTVQGGSCP